MLVDILTIFPAMFVGVLGESILKRAAEQGVMEFRLTDFRDFATDKHHKVDDTPFGGGSGMVLKPEPIFLALEYVLKDALPHRRVLLMDPGGVPFT